MIKYEELYNVEDKQRFLEEIEHEPTRMTLFFQLKNASVTEKQLDKDLYEMDIDELSSVLHDTASSTISSVHNYIMSFSRYIEWAIINGLTKNNINPLFAKDYMEWGRQFVASYKNVIFSRKDVINMNKDLVNATDRAIMLALFEGIDGDGFSEILNLKTKDLTEKEDGTFWAKLLNQTGETREIQITEELYKTLIDADSQPYYVNKNQNAILPQTATSQFVESDRIFKKSKRGKQGGDNLLNQLFINRKFIMFKETFENKYLTARDMKKSGICHMAHTIYLEKGKLETKDYVKIANHYDTIWTSTNGKRYRNVTAIKKILTSESVLDYYKVDMTK